MTAHSGKTQQRRMEELKNEQETKTGLTLAEATLDTTAQFGRIRAAVQLVSRLYLQRRPPRKADFQVIHDACLAVEEVDARGTEPQGWQPIETAPRMNGEAIRIARIDPNGNVREVYAAIYHEGADGEFAGSPWRLLDCDSQGLEVFINGWHKDGPTHWRPMIDLPQEASNA